MIFSSNQNFVLQITFYKFFHTIIIKDNSETPNEVNCLKTSIILSFGSEVEVIIYKQDNVKITELESSQKWLIILVSGIGMPLIMWWKSGWKKKGFLKKKRVLYF